MSIHELNPNIYMSDAAMEQFKRMYAPEDIAAAIVHEQVIVHYDGTENTDHAPHAPSLPNEFWANIIP